MGTENVAGQDVPSIDWLDAINGEIEDGLRNAESQHQAEKLAGNIVKEEYWKGECAVYHRLRHLVASNRELY